MTENKKHISEDILPISPEAKTLSGIANFAIWFSCSMVVTVMLTGMYFIPELSFGKVILLILTGSLIGIVPLILIGLIGQKSGLTTMVAARATFGLRGANLPSIINAIIYIGWQWAQAALGGLALNYISIRLIGFDSPAFYTILTEVVVIIIALYAIKGISIYEKFVAILIAIIMCVVIFKAVTVTGMHDIITLKPAPIDGLTDMAVFDLVVASALSWVAMSADYNRNCKSTSGTIIGTGAGYTLGTLFSMGVGALMVCMILAAGKDAIYEPAEAFGEIGLGIPGAILIIMSIIAANVMCMYSSTVSIINMFPKLNYTKTALAVGLICVLGAVFSGILDVFLNFVNLIAVLFMPIFAIMIVDFFFLKKQKIKIDAILYPDKVTDYKYTNGINWIAIVVFIICAAFCYFFTYVHVLPTGATIPTFFLTCILYYVMMKIKG